MATERALQHGPPSPIAAIVNISVIKKVRDFVITEVSFFLIKIMKLILLLRRCSLPSSTL